MLIQALLLAVAKPIAECRLCVFNTDVFDYILPLLDILLLSIFICGNVIITSHTVFSLPVQFPRSDEMLHFRLGTGNCSIRYLLARVSVMRLLGHNIRTTVNA